MGAHVQWKEKEEVFWPVTFNAKLCFYALDTIKECYNHNTNQYACLDQIYAYNYYCPPEFQKAHNIYSMIDQKTKAIYTKDDLKKLNHIRNVVYQSDIEGHVKYQYK